MIKYFKESIKRKMARRITKEYSSRIVSYDFEGLGKVEFAKWENPLAPPYDLELSMINFFKKFIKPGDFVIDIGANIGDTTVPMAIAAGKKGLTLAFDPNPFVFKILSANAKLNENLTNIHPVNSAIAQEDSEYYFISSEASFANGGISTFKDQRFGKYVFPTKISGVKLSDFLNKNYEKYLDKLSLIKVDCEGYDKEILKSIKDIIMKYRPIIISESYEYASDEAKMELFDVIAQCNYEVYYFEDFKENAAIRKLTKNTELAEFKQMVNVYGLPK